MSNERMSQQVENEIQLFFISVAYFQANKINKTENTKKYIC